MSKIIVDGTNGVTGYAADGTTVEKAYSVSALNGVKSSVFTATSAPLVVNGGCQFDGIATPPYLRFQDGTDQLLDDIGLVFIASNTETMNEPDQVHTFPSGIQSGDLLVMMQANMLRSSQGYAPSRNYGTGFTQVNLVSYQAFSYMSSQYNVGNMDISYKIATGSESGVNQYGFNTPNEPNGSAFGRRVLMVFRPTGYSQSGTVTVTHNSAKVTSGAETTTSHQHSVSITPSATGYSCIVGLYMSNQHPYNINTSYSDPSGATTYVQRVNAGSGIYQLKQLKFGMVELIQPGNSAVTFSGPTTSYVDAIALVCFTVT